jgi:hypothetical protein
VPFVDARLLFVALGRLAVYLDHTLRVEELELRIRLLANLVKWMDVEPVFFGLPTESANAVNQLLVALVVEVGLSAKEHHTTLGD